MTDEDVKRIAEGLGPAHRRMVLAAPSRRYKRWFAIKRHAKVSRVPNGTLHRLFEHDPETWWKGYRLSPLGLAVRAHLLNQEQSS